MDLEAARLQIEKDFGKGSILSLGDPSALVPVEVIPTGAATLDQALGVGGLPRGRIVEIFGPESSGKTTLVLSTLARAQAMGLHVAFIDAEHALDPGYAEALGCDVDRFLLSQPDYGEQALGITEALVRSGAVGVIAVDSVAALTPKAELDGEMGQQFMGLQARMMGQAMRKLVAGANQTKTLIIFTNQIREKVGVMFGSPETTPGGRALKFAASVRLDVRRLSSDGAKGEETSNRTKVTVRKNKVAPPFRIAEFDIRFGEGVDTAGCWLDLAIERGEVVKKGGWYEFLDIPAGSADRRGHGREGAREIIIARSLA